jgi:hydrogenase 3 maturation protease
MYSIDTFFDECLAGTDKLVIIGAGSCLKADDGAGVAITDKLIKEYGEDCSPRLRVYSGSTAPENYSGAVKLFGADHVIIIDAADFGEVPGEISTIDPEVISGVSFSTHMLPLKIFIQYLNKETGCKVTVLGIQPGDLTVNSPLSPPVKKSVSHISKALKASLIKAGMLRN